MWWTTAHRSRTLSVCANAGIVNPPLAHGVVQLSVGALLHVRVMEIACAVEELDQAAVARSIGSMARRAVDPIEFGTLR